MQDYFNQYVEEYYEVDESKEEVIEDQSSQVEEVKVFVLILIFSN